MKKEKKHKKCLTCVKDCKQKATAKILNVIMNQRGRDKMFVNLDNWADEHGESNADIIQGEEQSELKERLRQDYDLSDFIKIEIEANNITDLLQEVITAIVARFNQYKTDIAKLHAKKLEKNANYFAIEGELKALRESFAGYPDI